MSVKIIDTLKPKNGGSFPIVEAIDVFVENYGNLADAISHFATDAMIAAINAVLSGKANTADVNTAVTNLQNQINQIEISASAESVVAPEVVGARVGEDGTNYQTLKARLDTENARLQSNIEQVADMFDDIGVSAEISDYEFTSREYVEDTGRIREIANDAFNASSDIDVSGYSTITVKTALIDAAVLCVLNSDKSLSRYISGDGTLTTYSIELSANEKYIRTSFYGSDTSDFKVVGYINFGSVKDDAEIAKEDAQKALVNAVIDNISDATVTVVSGYYIRYDGKLREQSGYSYTENITLHSGESIIVTSKDASGSNIARISKWSETGKYVATIDRATTTVTTATYTASEPTEYVRVSYQNTNLPTIKLNVPDASDTFKSFVRSIVIANTSELDIKFSISMFENVAFCGDSYVAGSLWVGGDYVGAFPNLSWGGNIGRLAGITPHIYAKGGATTHSWLTEESCLPALLADNPSGMYIICLGINDSGEITTGSINDITDYDDYTQYPNTYYGNYGKIIEQIQEHAPNSKIIVMTPFHPSYNTQYVTPITEITQHYGIAMINTRQSKLCMNSQFTSMLVGAHPTAPLHSAMAGDIMELIQSCMNEYYTYFKGYVGV